MKFAAPSWRQFTWGTAHIFLVANLILQHITCTSGLICWHHWYQMLAQYQYSIQFDQISPGDMLRNIERKKVKSLSHVWLFATPWAVGCTRLLHPWDFPARVPEWVAISSPGDLSDQGSNPALGLPPCRQTLYPMSWI